MTDYKVNKISFKVETLKSSGMAEDFLYRIQYFLDGENLLNLINEEFKGYLGIPAFSKEALTGSKKYQEDNGKTMLLVCSCGEEGCGSLACRITEESNLIIWSEFEEVWGENTQYPEIGPFAFDRSQYYEAYYALRAMFNKTFEDKTSGQNPLTFEQAIRALDDQKDLYIEAPIDSLCHHLHGSVEREPLQEVLIFMAEQKGWPVYICQGHDED